MEVGRRGDGASSSAETVMVLDSEQQRNALLQLLKSSAFSGEQIEFVHALYQAIMNADIRDSGERNTLTPGIK